MSIHTKIIPICIIQIILRYFHVFKIQIFALIETKKKRKHKHSNSGYRADPTYAKKFMYMDIAHQQRITIKGLDISPRMDMCFINNVKFSANATRYFCKTKCAVKPSTTSRYSGIIVSGSNPSIAFYETPHALENNSNQTAVRVTSQRLPPLTCTIPTSAINFACTPDKLVYSNHYGLITSTTLTNMNTSILATLDFNAEDTTFEWKHINTLSTTVKRLHLIQSLPSIDDKVFEQVDYPYRWPPTARNDLNIFSLRNGTRKNIMDLPDAFRRNEFGIYYDMTAESLYILGGDAGCARAVNRFDFHKNTWMSTATTQFEHPYYPFAWMDGFVMYIAGGMKDRIGTVECYDTRYNRSHWILGNKSLQIDQILPPCRLKQIFGNNIL
eukprot:207568_1